METKEQPRFWHDCDNCKFLGRFESNVFGRFEEYDLYFCDKGHPTVVARYSSYHSDYLSGLNAAEPALIEAKKRAKALNLVP